MKPGFPSLLLLTAALVLSASAQPAVPSKAEAATALAMKRIADRYALTKARITSLLEPRMNPVPLPATLPNPFFLPSDLPPADDGPGSEADNTILPTGPDESDAGTLAKFAANLKVSGLTILNGVSHLTLNQTLCKVGDIIPLESKGRTVYIQILEITPTELTLGLNEEKQRIRLKR